MVIGFVVFIFCILGIYGYFDGNIILTYIGLILAVLEHIWGITSGQQKGFSTGWIAIICAIGMSCGGYNILESIAICMCFENVIIFSLGILLFIVTGIAMSKAPKTNPTETATTKTPAEISYPKITEEQINEVLEKEFEELLDLIKKR